MIGKLKGIIDSYGEDFVILDVGGVGYQVHCSARTLQELPAQRPAGDARRSRPMCARTRSGCSASPATSSANGSACCRRCRASAPRSRCRCSARSSPAELASAIAMRDKATVQRTPGVGRQGRRAHRHRAEGQGAGLCRSRSGGRAALRTGRRAGARRSRSPMRSPRWSISATASRRPPPRSRPRRAKRAKAADTAQADPARLEGTGAA